MLQGYATGMSAVTAVAKLGDLSKNEVGVGAEMQCNCAPADTVFFCNSMAMVLVHRVVPLAI